jgi:hypothetical protein
MHSIQLIVVASVVAGFLSPSTAFFRRLVVLLFEKDVPKINNLL